MYKDKYGNTVTSQLIGLTGPMGSGKSAIAQAIAHNRNDVKVLSFASPLKALATEMGWDGAKDAKGRRLLQLLGTDICRECIDTNYWVNAAKQVEKTVHARFIIFDDVRFPNEQHWIEDFGNVIRLDNRHNGKVLSWFDTLMLAIKPKHTSERQLEVNPNYIVDSSYSIAACKYQVMSLCGIPNGYIR